MVLTALLYLSTLLHLVLAFYVLAQGYGRWLNRTFSLFLVGVSLWSLTNAEFQNSSSESTMFLWALLAYTSGTILFSSLAFFSYHLIQNKIRKIVKVFLGFVTLVSFILPYIPNVTVKGVNFTERSIEGSTLLPILFLTYIILMLFALTNLFKGLFIKRRKERQQVRYVVFGIIASVFIGITTNLVLPSFNDYRFVALGPVFSLIFLIFVTYSILKYQFLDIRILVGRIAYFLLLAIIVVLGYRITIGLEAIIWDGPYDLRTLITALPLALFLVVIYDLIKKFIQEKIDSTLINPDFDPKEIITKFNKEMSTLLSYEDITDHALDIIGKTLRPKYKGMIVRDGNKIELTDDLKDNRSIDFDFDQLVSIWNSTGNYPILLDEVEIGFPKVFRNFQKEISDITSIMKENQIKLLLPIASPSTIVGVLLIGQREADPPYNSVQVDYLESIANLTGLALTRAFLYQEVKEFNVTLQKRIEIATQELAKQNSKLKESLANERDMLDVLGHELRTPLGILRNALGLFELRYRGGKVKEGDIEKFISVAHNNIRREIQLLETILASAKIDNAKLDLNFEKIDANLVVEDSLEAYRYEGEKKGLKFIINLPIEHLFAYADKLRVQQVLDNLVNNAIKYTNHGEIEIGLKDEGNFLKYYVRDTGLGIPEEDIPNLGKKFFRVHNYLESDGKIGGRKIVRPGGNGIGLYVVYQLIKYLGGTVDVKSREGEGSMFSFTILKYTDQVENQYNVLNAQSVESKSSVIKA